MEDLEGEDSKALGSRVERGGGSEKSRSCSYSSLTESALKGESVYEMIGDTMDRVLDSGVARPPDSCCWNTVILAAISAIRRLSRRFCCSTSRRRLLS